MVEGRELDKQETRKFEKYRKNSKKDKVTRNGTQSMKRQGAKDDRIIIVMRRQ